MHWTLRNQHIATHAYAYEQSSTCGFLCISECCHSDHMLKESLTLYYLILAGVLLDHGVVVLTLRLHRDRKQITALIPFKARDISHFQLHLTKRQYPDGIHLWHSISAQSTTAIEQSCLHTSCCGV